MDFPLLAGGTILPAQFIMMSTTADHTALACTSGARMIGVAQKGTRNTPMGAFNDGNAALAGESLLWYGENETCGLQLGGTVAAGDFLKSDVSGHGVTATADGDIYGAIASQAGISGQIIEVKVHIGYRGA